MIGAVRIFLLGMAGLAAMPALADCAAQEESFDSVYCYAKEFLDADAELNRVYGRLAASLSSRQRDILQAGELAWLQARNQACSYVDPESDYVDFGCAIEATRQRAQFLSARLTECSQAACRDELLGGR